MRTSLPARIVAGLFSFAAICFAVAAMTGGMALTVNGATSRKAPIVRDGELYVPVSALREGGAKVGRIGNHVWVSFSLSDPVLATPCADGKVSQWLSDGIWRLNVHSIDLVGGAYCATVELGNASSVTTYPAITGVNAVALYDDKNRRLELANGMEDTWSALTDYDIAPGASITKTLRFAAKSDFKPDRLILVVAPDADKRAAMRARHLAFTGAPSFRVKLTPPTEP